MKKSIFSIFLLLSIFFIQDYTVLSQNLKDTSQLDSLAFKIATYLSKIDSIQNRSNQVVYYFQKKSADSAIIAIADSNRKHVYTFDSIQFKINRGRLISTYLFLKNLDGKDESSVFYNNNKKVVLTSGKFNKRFSKYTLENGAETRQHISLHNYFLIYPNLRLKGNDYYPSDSTITFNRSNISTVQGINSYIPRLENYIEFDLLTDLEGLSDEYPNGLIQFEARASLALNRRFGFGTNIRFLYNVIPFIQFNKIDENNRNLPVLLDSLNEKYLNTFNLWQYSNLTIGAKLNILRWDAKNNRSNFFMDGVSMIIRTSITDSLPEPVTKNVNSIIWGLALKFRIRPIPNVPFWGDFSLGLNHLTLLSPDINQKYNLMYRPKDGVSDNNKSNELIGKFIMVPQIELRIIPSGGNTKYFVRVSFPNDFSKTGSNFLQVQIGTSISPDKLNEYIDWNTKGK